MNELSAFELEFIVTQAMPVTNHVDASYFLFTITNDLSSECPHRFLSIIKELKE